MPESRFLYHILAFWRGIFCTTFFQKSQFYSSQKRNEEAETVPHFATFSVPHLGSLLGPQMWYSFCPFAVVQFLPLHFDLCFRTFATNWGLFCWKNLNWKPSGHMGGTISACWTFWMLLFYNITCLLFYWCIFILSLFFSYFILFSHVILFCVMLALFQQTKKYTKKKKTRNKERTTARKERKETEKKRKESKKQRK